MLNVWMTRLSGLLAASCFQRNDAVQHRALVAFGIFSVRHGAGEIEDDLVVSDDMQVRHGNFANVGVINVSLVSTCRGHSECHCRCRIRGSGNESGQMSFLDCQGGIA